MSLIQEALGEKHYAYLEYGHNSRAGLLMDRNIRRYVEINLYRVLSFLLNAQNEGTPEQRWVVCLALWPDVSKYKEKIQLIIKEGFTEELAARVNDVTAHITQ